MSKQKLGAILVVIVAVIALVVTLLQWNKVENENERRTTLPSVVSPSTRALATSLPSTLSSSTQTSTVSPTTVAESSTVVTTEALTSISIATSEPPLLEPVVPAAPTALRIHEPGVDIDAIVVGMPFSSELVPPSCTNSPDPNCKITAHWVSDRLGTAPGYPTNNSTYILGHAWAEDDRVFNALSQRLMQYGEESLNGYKITVETLNSVLVYKISGVVSPRKQEISQQYTVWNTVPDRLVLIMCALDRDFNYIVLAQLIESHPK